MDAAAAAREFCARWPEMTKEQIAAHFTDDAVYVNIPFPGETIGGTIALDAMFGGPISGASMNPMRSLGPALVSGDLHALWLYIVAPVLGTSLGGLAYQFVAVCRRASAEPR